MCTCYIDLQSDLKLVADKWVRYILWQSRRVWELFLVFWETCPRFQSNSNVAVGSGGGGEGWAEWSQYQQVMAATSGSDGTLHPI